MYRQGVFLLARRKKMTVDEYIQNRDDLTYVSVSASTDPTADGGVSYEIVLRLDGTYYDRETADAQADFVSKTLGIKRW